MANDIVDAFVNKALSYEGKGESYWASTHAKYYYPRAWCAGFVCGVANEVGILGKVIDFSLGAHICAHSVTNHGGTWHAGSSSYTPQRGDLVNFVWNGGTWADHIGIVTSCSNGTVNTIEGNASSAVHQRHYSRSSRVLLGFGTPNWPAVGGVITSGESDAIGSSGTTISGVLFSETNTRKDAILREAAYLKTTYEPNSTKVKQYDPIATSTPIKLSVINYSDLFKTFWDVGAKTLNISGTSSSSSLGYDYSKLPAVVKQTVEFLVGKGLNNAAACGICGNIQQESSFNVGAAGGGLCQWIGSRGAAMRAMAGANWATNLTGQLNYLWYELSSGYQNMLNSWKSLPNTEAGARQAAADFCNKFERPGIPMLEKRQNYAAQFFKAIVQVATSSSSNFSSIDARGLSNKRQTILNVAQQELAKKTRYVWGGERSGVGLDCSGFCRMCYMSIGITLPHQSESMRDVAPHRLPVNQAVAGDILWTSGHVALYIGNGKTIEEYQGGPSNTYSNPGGLIGSLNVGNRFKLCLHWDI